MIARPFTESWYVRNYSGSKFFWFLIGFKDIRLKITLFFKRRYLGNRKLYRGRWKRVLKGKVQRFRSSFVRCSEIVIIGVTAVQSFFNFNTLSVRIHIAFQSIFWMVNNEETILGTNNVLIFFPGTEIPIFSWFQGKNTNNRERWRKRRDGRDINSTLGPDTYAFRIEAVIHKQWSINNTVARSWNIESPVNIVSVLRVKSAYLLSLFYFFLFFQKFHRMSQKLHGG